MEIENEDSFVSGWRVFMFILPPLVLLYFGYEMTDVVITDMILYYTCQSLFPTNKHACDLLHTNSSSEAALELEKIVQPQASYIILCDSVMNSVISASLILFIGPWSDQYGRKPLLIMGCFASTIRYILIAIFNYWYINPWMFMVATIPMAISGGPAAAALAVTCYISDIMSSKKRAWFLACVEWSAIFGSIIGTYIGPLIFQKFGYVTLFLMSSGISVIALLYTIFYVPESVKKEIDVKWNNPFNIERIKEIFEATTIKRPGLDRLTLWSCILSISLRLVIAFGEGKIIYLFVSARVGWNAVDFSKYQIFSVILTGTGSMLGLKLTKKYLGLKDITQALIGCISDFFTILITSLSFKSWHLYLATCVGAFAGMPGPTVRSIMSSSAPTKDMGKIFSLVTFMECIIPLAAVPLYTLIYTNYMPPIYPSPVYLLSVGIYSIIMFLMLHINWRTTKYSPVSQEPPQEH